MKTGKDLINFIVENKLEDVVIDSEWQEEDKIWMTVKINENASIDYTYEPSTGNTEIKWFEIVEVDHDDVIVKALSKEEALILRGLEL